MKKVLFFLAAFAAVAVSCAKVEEPVAPVEPETPVFEGVEFTLNAMTTKTVADGYSTKWAAGDMINIFNAPKDGAYSVQGAFSIAEEDIDAGKFTGSIKPLDAESYSWAAVYPYNEANTDLAALALNFGDAEQALATAPALAGANVPLIGATADVAADAAVSVAMHHLASALKITVKNDNEDEYAVSEIALTFPSAVVGAFTVNAADMDAITYAAADGASATVTLKADEAVKIAAGASATFYAVIAPCTVAKDATISYTINGKAGELVANSDIAFKAGKVKPISLTAPSTAAVNLSADATANCYIVSEAGYYSFAANVKGVGAAGIHETFTEDTDAALAPAGAKLVWEEATGIVSNVAYADNKICFDASGAQGNAVIAATDADGNIIWSWHIWSGYTLAEIVVEDENMSGYKYGFLSRNLGAFEETDSGLYYQWGRKDPFSKVLAFDSANGEGKYHPVTAGSTETPEATVNTIAYATAHPIEYLAKSSNNNDWLLATPQRYLWGQNWETDGNPNYSPFGKTIYDPCPAGYSVATPTSMANTTVAAVGDGSYTLYGGKILVPLSSFIYNGGYGWWSGTAANLWTNSTSWSNVNNAFRRTISDGRDGYDRACGIPVRCFRDAR